MKLLCAGDLHIGRRSSKLPDSLDGPAHSCAAAWDAVVETALAERVDVVALSGDLVDQANRFFEAIGPLERGLRRLLAAGIDTFAVAGNHDHHVLPQLAETLASERFHLLGHDGRWERRTVERDGRPTLHVDGWSFPSEHVAENPLDTYDPPPAGGTPVLGLLHADLDQPGSQYGPVTLSDLQRQPVTLWLLGHIHAGAIYAREGAPPVIYPGSPQAMDPGETGVHGVVLAEIDRSGRVTTRRIPLSSVCYLALDVDMRDVETDDDARDRVYGALREAVERDEHRYERLACLSCRLTLTGRTPLHGRLRQILGAAEEDLNLTAPSGLEAVVERIDYQTRPALDLEQLAARNDPPGEVARVIQAIEAGEAREQYGELVDGTLRQLRSIHRSRFFQDLPADAEPDEADALGFLQAEAWSLLDALIAQKEAV